MKQKLIFFDIDGTIIDHYKKEIPKSTIFALKELKKNNHIVAIATGKGPKFIQNMFDDIKFDTYVGLNGNYVVFNEEVIYRNYIAESSIKRFCDYCFKNNLAFVLSDEQCTKTLFKNDERIRLYYNSLNMPYPKVIDSINDYTSFFQMTIMIEDGTNEKIVTDFPELTFVRMTNYGMNVVSNGGLKERGIKKILERTHFCADDIIVFGDGLNDIGMFKLAKTSVAMGNAYQELKKHATHVTDHISNDGIYKACQKLNLID